MAKRWISLDKKSSPPKYVRNVESVVDELCEELKRVLEDNAKSLSENSIKQIKKRNLIKEK